MLKNASVHPTIPVVDLDRPKNFYSDVLGLEMISEDPSQGALLKAGDNTTFYMYQREATKADHTVMAFAVDDVEKTIKDLREKGVEFEEYDTPDIKTVEGIATLGDMKAAWFKDSEGNILSINNMEL